MAKVYNVEEAASWSEEFTEEIVEYLTDRTRWWEIRRIEELRNPAPPPETLDLTSATASQVAEWVGDDVDRAKEALEWELANKNRAKLVAHLKSQVGE